MEPHRPEPHRPEHPHVPGPSLWPVGFAVGVAVLLVGLVISPLAIGTLGAVLALAFGFLWVRDLASGSTLTHAPTVDPEVRASKDQPALPADAGGAAYPHAAPDERYPRSKFLELSTLGLGGVIGGLVTLPVLGFAVGPAFLKQGGRDHDLGPIDDYPEGKFVVATFMSRPEQGEVTRRTAFVRNNGQVKGQPSFTVISNHCAHLGCPVQPNGQLFNDQKKQYKDVTIIPTQPAGFGCPCHGGQYDTEGNRTAGPPVRALDRYSFSIRKGNLFLGPPFSVSRVEGAGGTAKIKKWTYAFPGEPVSGLESWLYPIQPPH